jgi:hypothetical protein
VLPAAAVARIVVDEVRVADTDAGEAKADAVVAGAPHEIGDCIDWLGDRSPMAG